jgi:hypothetical protein
MPQRATGGDLPIAGHAVWSPFAADAAPLCQVAAWTKTVILIHFARDGPS